MPKSNYPQQLDTSVEIPPVRDNVTEIGSDVINSLRSAIFNIEKALGINPQGSVGNNLATRLARALDENGNIKSEALERANVLSGPIIDVNVSTVAAIKESKLKLDYPTTLLQDEISILNNSLDLIQSQIEELSALISAHVEPTAINRHKAIAITVDAADAVSSDIATLELEGGGLQDVLEELYNAHINYSGANISTLNNSHTAEQIFYDKEETSDVIFSDNLQGAIEDLANIEAVGFRNAILNLNSNGRIRAGSITDDYEENSKGSVLLAETSATYLKNSAGTKTTFTISTPVEAIDSISVFDILTLSGSPEDEDNGEYQIYEVRFNADDEVTEIDVFGGPNATSQSGLLIMVTKNQYVIYNQNGFNATVRPRSNKTNTPDILICNPDCATIISSGIAPEKINEDDFTIDIAIDGGEAITIETYDSTIEIQTVDSIVQKVNDQCVDQHLNISAYKVFIDNRDELAISHNVPNIANDIVNRTLKMTAGTNNDGSAELGFTDSLGILIEGSSGNSLHLNGLVLSDFGKIQEFDETTIELIPGSLTLSLFTGTFAALGVRVGDMVVVTGSTEPDDDGSYRISSVNSAIIDLDLAGVSFSGTLDEDSKVYIIRNSAPIGDLTFSEISAIDGSIIFDVFMTDTKDIFFSKRLEVDGSLRDGPLTAGILDVSRNFILADETATISINTTGYATLTGPDLVAGDPVYVGQTGKYKLFSASGLSFVILDVKATAAPFNNISVTLYGFNEVSRNNYHICRGSFSTSLGRILGETTEPGIPILLGKRRSGTADVNIVGESFIEKYIEGPRNELRTSGIIRGCEVSNPQYFDTGSDIYQTFDVSAGVYVVSGKRLEFSGVEEFRINSDSNYFIAFNNQGSLVAAETIADPDDAAESVSPFFDQETATLAFIESDEYASEVIDLRLFIDNLDLKVIGDIKVAVDQRHGHFTEIKKAVAYARRFKQLYPDMEAPVIQIENGTYEIDEQIVINFDLQIKGSGMKTQLTKTGALAAGVALEGDDVALSTAIFLIGNDVDASSTDIDFGVTIGNLLYDSNQSELDNVGCVIALTQPIRKAGAYVSRRANFKFHDISFLGPSTIDGVVADPEKIGEYAIVLGQQNENTLAPIADLEMGNIFIQNCRFHQMGLEKGAIKMLESSGGILKNVCIIGNIATDASPNLNDTNAIILEYPTTPTTQEIVEIGNIRRN